MQELKHIYGSLYVNAGSYHLIFFTHCGRDETAAILLMTFWNAFSDMKTFQSPLKSDHNLFPRVKIIKCQCWVRWVCTEQVTSHYMHQWWHSLLRHICTLGLDEFTTYVHIVISKDSYNMQASNSWFMKWMHSCQIQCCRAYIKMVLILKDTLLLHKHIVLLLQYNTNTLLLSLSNSKNPQFFVIKRGPIWPA